MVPIHGADPDTPPLPKRFGDYELHDEVARGAMGVVFRARQSSLDRIVAVKMILAGKLASPAQVQRFLAEARAAGKLRHAGIVPVHEVGEYDGQPFYSMDFIEGESLAQRIDRGKLSPHDAARIVRALAEAVQYAHSHGIVHRDLKPSNVMLDAEGHPWITDFGLSKAVESEQERAGATEALGTPNFMAPEQAHPRGASSGPAVDVYGLGAVLYSLLSGRPPFLGADVILALRQLHEREPTPISVLAPEVPEDLAVICERCLEKEPAQRYPSAAAVADDLRRWLSSRPILARPSSLPKRLRLFARRRPLVATLAAGLALMTVLGAAGVTWQWRTATRALAAQQEAEQSRVLARVRALETARHGAFLELLSELDDGREETRAALVQRTSDSTLSSAALLRLRLALLRHEESGLEDCVEALLQQHADSREFTLAVAALGAARASVSEDGWSAAIARFASAVEDSSRPREEVFHAAVALASLAPENAAWHVHAEALALRLDTANPFLLAGWNAILRPYPPPLLDALAKIFREGEVTERTRAAQLLADGAAHDPAWLAGLLPHGDAAQQSALLTALRGEEAVALARLDDALGVEPAARALVVPPDGAAPAADAVVATLHDAGGALDDRCAFAVDLDAEGFAELCESLAHAGYRLVRARAAGGVSAKRVSAVWWRDGADFRLALEVTAEERDAAAAEARAAGLHPVDASTSLVSLGGAIEVRYTGVWGPLPRGVEEARILWAVPHDQRDETHGAIASRGFVPAAYSIGFVEGGAQVHTTVWLAEPNPGEHFIPGSLRAESYERGVLAGLCQLEVQVGLAVDSTEFRPDSLRYAGIWLAHPRYESRAVPALDPAAHRERAQELSEEGFVPTSLCLLSSAPARGNPTEEATAEKLVASVWLRERPLAARAARSVREAARAEAARFALGDEEALERALGPAAGPGMRAHVATTLSRLPVSAMALARRLRTATDAAFLRSLLLSLGSWDPAMLEPALRADVVERAQALAAEHRDPGVHAAALWLLRGWGERGRVLPGVADPPPGARWSLAAEGHVLAHLPTPTRFTMGSPGHSPARTAAETPHTRQIDRRVAIAMTEVTRAQFDRFSAANPRFACDFPAAPDGAATTIDWLSAVAYCRWLSEQAGFVEEDIPYPPLDTFGRDMAFPPDFLERPGFRLPTEAEWEFACRAGTETSRFFGDDPELLPFFAQARANSGGSIQPVASLRPNAFGLFDVLGNALEWVHDGYGYYPLLLDATPVVDRATAPQVLDAQYRILRGGSFDETPDRLRSATRRRAPPGNITPTVGFRIARTLP